LRIVTSVYSQQKVNQIYTTTALPDRISWQLIDQGSYHHRSIFIGIFVGMN
jgi:hypothetical protein